VNRPAHHAPARMTQAYNDTAAMMKITMAPLATLTDAMIESIARSHCGKREGSYEAMLAELRGRVETRRRREI
jgi:hypothetical protein